MVNYREFLRMTADGSYGIRQIKADAHCSHDTLSTSRNCEVTRLPGASPRTPEVYRFGVSRKGDAAVCLGAGQKKSDAAGITLPANLRTGAQVAPLRCLILRHGQKHYDDTTIFPGFQAACWPPIMALTGRELRPCWPPNAAICNH